MPDVLPMSEMVRAFALRLLRRLQTRPRNVEDKKPTPEDDGTRDASMEDGEMPQEAVVQTFIK